MRLKFRFVVTVFSGLLFITPLLMTGEALLSHLSDTALWMNFFSSPGLLHSILLSLWVGLGSSLIVLSFVLVGLSHSWNSPAMIRLRRMLPAFLAIPHVAFSIGFTFMIAPSGWLIRAISPWLTGYVLPPDVAIIHDPAGLTLMTVLVIKETPFLFLMALSAIKVSQTNKIIQSGSCLGFSSQQIWWRIIIPELWPRIRFPLMVITAYSIGSVELPILLGPTNPPLFVQQVWLWSQDTDPTRIQFGDLGAIILIIMTLFCFISIRFVEWFFVIYSKRWSLNGHRQIKLSSNKISHVIFDGLFATYFISIVLLVLWSITRRWSFPHFLPDSFSLHHWYNTLHIIEAPLVNSLILAITSSAIALFITILILENQLNSYKWPIWIVCLPLLLPQTSLLLGMNRVLVMLGLDTGTIPTILGHFIYVFPYLYLSLVGSWFAFEQRWIHVGQTLNHSPLKSWWKIKLPILSRSLCIAFAVAMSVSFSQYLSTLILGGGRIITITTEAVTISTGYNRRLAAIYGLLQLILPIIIYIIALWLPKKINRLENHLNVEN